MPLHSVRAASRRPLLSSLQSYSRCPSRLPVFTTTALLPPDSSRPCHPTCPLQQLRSFNFLPSWMTGQKKTREAALELPPGTNTLEKLHINLTKNLGPRPSEESVIGAFRDLVGFCHGTNDVPNVRSMRLLRLTYRYLSGIANERGDGLIFPLNDEKNIEVYRQLLALKCDPENPRFGTHLGRDVYNALLAAGYQFRAEDIKNIVNLVLMQGYMAEAIGFCTSHEKDAGLPADEVKSIWTTVLDFASNKNDEQLFLRVLRRCRLRDFSLLELDSYELLFYCRSNDMQKAKECYKRLVEQGVQLNMLSPENCVEVLKACSENGELEWFDYEYGQLRSLLDRSSISMDVDKWKTVLQWACSSGDTNEVLALLHKMYEKAQNGTGPAPDPTLIDELAALALDFSHRELAEQLFETLETYALQPTPTTIELRIKLALQCGDVNKAIEHYRNMSYMTTIQVPFQAVEVQNLVKKLAQQRSSETYVKELAEIYQKLREWRVRLEISTLRAIIRVFLRNGYFEDAQTSLIQNAWFYTSSEKKELISTMTSFICKESTSVQAAWRTYQLVQKYLPETGVATRTRYMRKFFDLDRASLAANILAHMRQAEASQPDALAYTTAFKGLARTRDFQTLLSVHRQLNVDPNIEVTTDLYNALMNAYSRCGLYRKATWIFDSICRMREGPNTDTLAIGFDICAQDSRMGLSRCRVLWQKFMTSHKTSQMPFDENVVCAYIEALNSHGEGSEALQVVKTLQQESGVRPTPRILSVLFRTFDRTRTLIVEEFLDKYFLKEWAAVKEELQARWSEVVAHKGPTDYELVDDEGIPVEELPKFKSSLNIPGSTNYDPELAELQAKAWMDLHKTEEIKDGIIRSHAFEDVDDIIEEEDGENDDDEEAEDAKEETVTNARDAEELLEDEEGSEEKKPLLQRQASPGLLMPIGQSQR